MLDEEFRVSPDRVEEQDLGRYNWEKYPPIYLQPVIMVEDELAIELGEAIQTIVKQIAAKHDKPLQKVEVVSGRVASDMSYGTVFVRWTSSQGMFEHEFEVVRTSVPKRALYPLPAPVLR